MATEKWLNTSRVRLAQQNSNDRMLADDDFLVVCKPQQLDTDYVPKVRFPTQYMRAHTCCVCPLATRPGHDLTQLCYVCINIQLAGQTVREILDSCGHVASSGVRSTGTSKEWVIDQLELRHLLGRNVEELSGGELQRLAVSQIALMDAGGLNLVVFVSPTQVSVETIGCG